MNTDPTALDVRLARSPFGNHSYIIEQLHVRYLRRLGELSARLPSAGELRDGLVRANHDVRSRVLGDTVVRCAVHYAMTFIETSTRHGLPIEQCDEVFHATARHIEENQGEPLGEGWVGRLGTEPYHGWIWSANRSDDVFSRSFRSLVEDQFGESPCSPTADEVALLAKGARLLSELLPESSRSALGHAHRIALFAPEGRWEGVSSFSQFALSGAIFLRRDQPGGPWWVAEHLLHEALHQQMYDFRQGHTLFDEQKINREDGARVNSPWNRPDSKGGDRWSTFRALGAFHVYVYTALLCIVAEERAAELEGEYGPMNAELAMCGSRKALERARYLGERIRALCWGELGLAGRRFVDWFGSVLDLLDPAPPS
jgi:hypothetical protein